MLDKTNFNIILSLIVGLLVANLTHGQTNYIIDANVNINDQTLIVSQTINFKNSLNQKIDKIYLSDWANSYEGTESPLVKHLANQFNRSFYISAKSKLGYTVIKTLTEENVKLEWSRLNKKPDVIEVFLNSYLDLEEEINLHINYEIKIPDDKFTGYGINSNDRIFFRDFFISISPFFSRKWAFQSNLGLRDNNNKSSNYIINWIYSDKYNLFSNLNKINSDTITRNGYKYSKWEAKGISSPEFVFDEENKFQTIVLDDGFKIVTDILPSKNAEVDINESLKRIYDFSKTILSPLEHKKILILKKDYFKNPIVGITEALSFLNPFSDSFIYETKFIKAYLASYLHELLEIDKRGEHWIPGGIQTYIMMKYVEYYYPNSKFLGVLKDFKILGIRPFNSYSAAQIGFNESFSFIYEF